MAKHRRHSSLDTLGWMYTHRTTPPPGPLPEFLSRSISTRVSSFGRDLFPHFKRQTSISNFHPGEYFAGCFGTRRTKGSDNQMIFDFEAEDSSSGRYGTMEGGQQILRRPPRSRSYSVSSLSDASGMGAHSGANRKLEMRAAELNRLSATDEYRVRRGGRWVIDSEEYMKPPAWKSLLWKLRAQAKRHVHPAPLREWTNYDAQSYEKNFDEGGKTITSTTFDEDDELGIRERELHTKILTKFHSGRFDSRHRGLLNTLSVPTAPIKAFKESKEEPLPIWQRRTALPPLKLELTRSI